MNKDSKRKLEIWSKKFHTLYMGFFILAVFSSIFFVGAIIDYYNKELNFGFVVFTSPFISSVIISLIGFCLYKITEFKLQRLN